MEGVEAAILACQQRNPVPWMELLLHVETKDNQIMPFRLGPSTKILANNFWNRMVVLKARQVWATTFFQACAYAFACCIPGFKVGLVLHEAGAGERAFQRIKLFHETMPSELRPRLSYDRKDLIQFADSRSAIFIGTSSGFDFGRSGTLNMLILSEFAHYLPDDAEKALLAAGQAVPIEGWAVVESTPHGIGMPFHNLYASAKETPGVWRPVVIPWHAHEEYTLSKESPYTLPEDRELIPSPDEMELQSKYGLTSDQLRWRRYKIDELRKAHMEESFDQEYPHDDISCWLSSQEGVYPQAELALMFQNCRTPRIELGFIKKWKGPEPSTRYLAFADTSEGLPKGDLQYACTLNCVTGEQIAAVCGQMPPDEFARLCVEQSREYNNALLAFERNQGALCIDVAQRLGYGNLYKPTADSRPGFVTSVATKPKMVSAMISAIKSGEFRSYDEMAVRQLIEYRLLRDQRGIPAGYAAPKGRHDDGAIACMGANLLRQFYVPVPNLRQRQVQLYPQRSLTW